MAFQDLVGADCGGANSLMRLTSHFVQDHAFKEEGIHRTFGTPEVLHLSDSEKLVKQFLEENSACPQTYKMDNLLQEMREIDQSIQPPIPAPGVVKELTSPDNAVWANQYLQSGGHFDERTADNIWTQTIAENTQCPINRMQEIHELGLHPKWAEDYLEHSIDNIRKDNDENGDEGRTNSNSKGAHSKFMKFMRGGWQGTRDSAEDSQDLEKDAEEVKGEKGEEDVEKDTDWTEENKVNGAEKGVEEESRSDDDVILNKVEQELSVAGGWINEFQKENVSSADDDLYKSSFWRRFEDEWDKLSSSEGLSTKHPWVSEFETYYDPFNDYEFHEENPMKNMPNALDEGKKRLLAGDLPSAILCFEAAVQQEENNAEAWFLLGKTQAENEQDPLAIVALKRCLNLDPTNSAALMALAVSYTNESYQNQACLTLKEWLLKNERYKHLLPLTKANPDQQPKSSVSTILFDDVHKEVKKLYIEAARMNPHDQIDPDVQCGLGVLFNLSNEYDKAIDCFLAALQVRPDDSRLWNRLGATLSNGQRSEEAINAYHRALELSPGFVRARYNLGISCINLGAYKEAGEHLLTALNQQAAGRGTDGENMPAKTMSNVIWSTLRLVVSLMHKYQLTDAIENRDLSRLNKEFEIV